MTSMSSIAVPACYVQLCKTHKNKVLCRLHSKARYGYMYVMDSLVPRLLYLKTGRETGRFDHVARDVACMVLCVVLIIELLPTQSVSILP